MMNRDQIEELLVDYGVAFTSSLADKLSSIMLDAYREGYKDAETEKGDKDARVF